MQESSVNETNVFNDSKKYFPTPLQEFQFYDKYSRFNWDDMRRETWEETVTRAVDYLIEVSENKLPEEDYKRIKQAILKMEATPSMRLLAMGGKAARRHNQCIYNCSYLPIDSPEAWVEALIISMCGCGVGFSVESKYVNKLPPVKKQTGDKKAKIKVEDTMEGWTDALRMGINIWLDGGDVEFDYSLLRPAGTPLKTKGGHSSGPQVLTDTLDFIRMRILNKQGQKLTTLDAHDIMCKVGDASISGGVRRTAMISLFDFDDELMLTCKDGDFAKHALFSEILDYKEEHKKLEEVGTEEEIKLRDKIKELEEEYKRTTNIQRYNSNNSSVWPDRKLTRDEVQHFVQTMDASERGEPGIFIRKNAEILAPMRRKAYEFGTNPCGEINLRPFQFCNLTIAVARYDDTYESLKEKVEIATIIGTIQSAATHFPGLRPIWKYNCDEERLLGVDITGQMDSPVVQSEIVLSRLKRHAYEVNKKYAKLLGINQSAAITCNKPSGNSSVLFDCSSGIHPRYSKYYIRRVRVNAHSPTRKVFEDCGVPLIPETGSTYETADKFVVEFPVRTPDDMPTRDDLTLDDQFNNWLRNKIHWTEHNPSCTIYYKKHELDRLTDLIYQYQDFIGGLSFLPHSDAKYPLMPYEEITEDEYQKRLKELPDIDWAKLTKYEETDMTEAAQLIACVNGSCDI